MNFVEMISSKMGGEIKAISSYVDFVMSRRVKDIDNDTYIERHHILPRSIFPEFEDDDWNIVPLKPEDHFISHKMLAKSTEHPTAICAFWAMANQVRRGAGRGKVSEKKIYEVTAEDYSLSREMWLESMKDNQYSKGHIPWNKGKKLDEEYRKKLSDSHKGFVPERLHCPHCDKDYAINIAKQYHFEKCKALTGKNYKFKTVSCPHCNKEGGANIMYRYHFDNCKSKP